MNRPNQHNDLSDDKLLQLYKSSGDNKWFGLLLQRYTLLLLGVAMKYMKNKTVAEDAVQQVFYKALTSLPDDEIRNFKGWLYILMRNHCLQLLREKKHYDIPANEIQIAEQERQEALTDNVSIENINEAMKTLTEEQKHSVEMFYLKQMSYQQIMEQTGYSYMQVKSYIQNGKRNLKQYLQKFIKNG